MADKVLTLTNKDGTDNIYPIAGGMMANSISTAMLQDGSVTSDKIDWTTIEVYTNPSDVFDSTLGTVSSLCVFKLGKIVWLQRLSFDAHTTNQAGTVVATLKSKFWPKSNTRTPVMASTGNYINSITQTSGQMVEYTTLTNGTTYYSSTTWITN